MDWDDDDEKTTVFDRSSEESARALLQKSPSGRAEAKSEPASQPREDSPRPTPSKNQATPARASAPASEPPQPEPTHPRAAAPTASGTTASAKEAPPSSSGLGKLLAVAGVIVAALVLAWFFMGGEKTGSLVVAVAGPGGKAVDEISVLVDGESIPCADGVCEASELEEGTHRVKVSAPGYANSAVKVVKISPNDESVLNIELVAESEGTGIRVTTKASGLSLSVDGKEIGPLPQTLDDMTPGSHRIEISGSNFFEPFEKEVTVRADEMLDVEPELKLIRGQLTVKRGENAKGAKIYLVGGPGRPKSLHKADLPIKINLPADESYRIEASRDGYEDFEQVVAFTVENPELTVEVSLEEESDDAPASSAPASRQPAAATPSPAPATQPAAAPAPAPEPTPAPAATGNGSININSIPVSNVILDGRPLGTTPKVGVSVPAGSHTVVFVHPQYGRKVRQVTVPAGGTATAAVRFP